MAKLLIFYLNLSCLVLLVLLGACTPDNRQNEVENAVVGLSVDAYSNLSPTEQKAMSEKLLQIGMSFYGQGSPKSMEFIEQAIMLDSTNAAAWRELSIPYLKRGYAHQWHELIDKAVYYDPETWMGYRATMKLYFYRDFEGAIADFNATDTITPNFTDYPQGQSVDYMRGLCYMGLGQYATAIDWYNKYIAEVTEEQGEKWVDVYAFLYKGITFNYLQQYDSALLNLNKGLSYYPNSADMHYHMAKVHLAMQRPNAALESWQKGLTLFDQGNYQQRPYVEVLEQLYDTDFTALHKNILAAKAKR